MSTQFSSIMNLPSNESNFSRIYSYLQNTIFNQKQPPPQQNLQQPSFTEYLQSISHLHNYNTNPNNILTPKDLNQPLLQMLNRLPPQIFKNQELSLIPFFKAPHKCIQELTQYLDEVEINLFYQINGRFYEFLKVIVTLYEIQKCLRIALRNLQMARLDIVNLQNIVMKGNRIAIISHKKAIKANILKKLKLIKQFHFTRMTYKLNDTIQKLIQSGNSKESIQLLKATKNSYEQLKGLVCLKSFNKTLKKSQQSLKKSIEQYFFSSYLNYLKNGLNNSIQLDNIEVHNYVSFENTYEMNSILEQSVWLDQKSNKNDQGIPRDIDLEHRLKDILITNYFIMDFSSLMLKIAITKQLKLFFNNFMTKVKQYCFKKLLRSQDRNIKVLEEGQQNDKEKSDSYVMNQISAQFHCKVIQLFSNIMKNFLIRELGVCDLFLNELGKVGDLQVIKWLLGGVGCSIKFIVQKVVYLIYLKKIDISSIQNFKKYIQILIYWQNFDQHQLPNLLKQSPQIQQIKSKEKIHFQEITECKFQLENHFIKTFSQMITKQLEESLQKQTYSCLQIPSQYYQPLSLIINSSGKKLGEEDGNLNYSVGQSIMMDMTVQMCKIKIVNQDVIIDDQKFKVTQSLLHMLEIFEDLIKIQKEFPTHQPTLNTYLKNIILLYSKTTKQHILDAKAFDLQQFKRKRNSITTKDMALSSKCLSFVRFLVPFLLKQCSQEELCGLQQVIYNYICLFDKKIIETVKNKICEQSKNLKDCKQQKKDKRTINIEKLIKSLKTVNQILLEYYNKSEITIFYKEINSILKKYYYRTLFQNYMQEKARLPRLLSVQSRGQIERMQKGKNWQKKSLKEISKLVRGVQGCESVCKQVVEIKEQFVRKVVDEMGYVGKSVQFLGEQNGSNLKQLKQKIEEQLN